MRKQRRRGKRRIEERKKNPLPGYNPDYPRVI